MLARIIVAIAASENGRQDKNTFDINSRAVAVEQETGMKSLDEKLAYGLKVFGEIMGEDKAAGLRAASESTGFGSDISRLAINYAFADVWGDDKLERKQRSLVTLGILIASRQTLELKNHVRIAVRNGLSARELEGVLLQAVPYVGFPAIASATTAVLETLRELGIDTSTRTSEERGLL